MGDNVFREDFEHPGNFMSGEIMRSEIIMYPRRNSSQTRFCGPGRLCTLEVFHPPVDMLPKIILSGKILDHGRIGAGGDFEAHSRFRAHGIFPHVA